MTARWSEGDLRAWATEDDGPSADAAEIWQHVALLCLCVLLVVWMLNQP